MFDEIKKSLSSILYERTTSPFYGTLIVSWLLWNWRIVYLTFFISEKSIQIDKITYITNNLSNIHLLVTFPLCSTLLLTTIVPFISNGAFWLNLKFENWKKNKKNQIERKQLLSLEQSLELREQLIHQESRFEKLLEDKNTEIKQLKDIITQSNSKTAILNRNESDENIKVVYDKISKDSKLLKEFEEMIELIQHEYQITDRAEISSKLITLLEVHDIITPNGGGVYSFTDTGKELIKLVLE